MLKRRFQAPLYLSLIGDFATGKEKPQLNGFISPQIAEQYRLIEE
ncbi:hypothetical protein [Hoeflea prorocentri]|uniref:Uncharacterized protein n=1 Tax=Hoeflea prorocentri TaxID=1922333 RepID=A0A9X3UPH6_9HYPH|nr:hypothetical protein [Hoeflea prorocentri]MCY6382821.1 hypothetical protein [Hoeflea prorocentri]MDA5400621.1 hypothetical protein [Hoeflea prorocentri]